MADTVTVEELEIIVRAKVDEAVKSLEKVLKKMGEVSKQAAKPIADTISKISDPGTSAGRQIKQVADTITKESDRIKKSVRQAQEFVAKSADANAAAVAESVEKINEAHNKANAKIKSPSIEPFNSITSLLSFVEFAESGNG